MIKNLLFLTTLMLSTQAFSADKLISCANDTCVGNFGAISVIEKPFYTAMDVGPNNDNIVVTVPTSQTPRSLRINVENGATPRNLLLNLSSQKATANAGSTLIIGDLFNNLEIKLDGYSGRRGQDASQICAERVKLGQYGTDAKNFFEQRRAADPALNPSRCDRIDLSYLQSFSFTCDDPTYSQLVGTNPVVEVNRIRFKARCSGVLVQDLCLKIKRAVACVWRRYYWVCPKGGCYKQYEGVYATYNGIFDELFYNQFVNSLGSTGFCERYVGRPGGNYDLHDLRAPQTSPGVNASYDPLPGSIWQRYRTQAYGRCNQYWATVRTETVSKFAYDETGIDCDKNSVGIPEDPNRIIPWAYAGMAQEPEFGTESLQCAIGECPVSSTLSDLQRSLDVIVPESGDNGTQQGNGIALVYDASAISSSSILGQAGSAGMADLDSPESTKYCGKIRDSQSDGINSAFARNPSVSFRRYNWKALRTSGGGNNGVQPPASTNSVEIYKKLDPSARYLLAKELL